MSEIKWNYDKAEEISTTLKYQANNVSTSSVDYPSGVKLTGSSRCHEFYARMCSLTTDYVDALCAEADHISSCNATLKDTDTTIAGG